MMCIDIFTHTQTFSNIFKQFQTYIILHNITYSNTGKLWKACLLSTRMMSPARTGLVHAGRGLVVVEPRCGATMCYVHLKHLSQSLSHSRIFKISVCNHTR